MDKWDENVKKMMAPGQERPEGYNVFHLDTNPASH